VYLQDMGIVQDRVYDHKFTTFDELREKEKISRSFKMGVLKLLFTF